MKWWCNGGGAVVFVVLMMVFVVVLWWWYGCVCGGMHQLWCCGPSVWQAGGAEDQQGDGDPGAEAAPPHLPGLTSPLTEPRNQQTLL